MAQPHPLAVLASDLLATKLFTPQPHTNSVPRPRLLTQLDRALTVPLTLVAAPAGAGKTTLLADWLNSLRLETRDVSLEDPLQVSSLKPQAPGVAWLSLDAEDNDQATFVRYLVAACQQLAPHVGATVLALLPQAQQLTPAELLRLLINDLAALLSPSVVILDDCHVLTNPALHAMLLFLLEYLPPQLHLVIASRIDPPLPLARLRARRQLIELRAADLRFTAEESAVFLKDMMALPLSAADLATFETRTEGWIAGLQLAALSLQNRPAGQLTSFIDAFAGSHRFVVDYLADEVITRQPQHIQTFLLETAILERLCGPLCDAVLGLEARDLGLVEDAYQASSPSPLASQAYSQLILEQIEHRNLFIIPLDDVRQWYRYHHLFAQVLRQRLLNGASLETVAHLHCRAAAWFEQQGLAAEAVHHALAGHDWERAARLITAHGRKLMVRGQVHTVRGWLNKLPAAVASDHPYLHHLQAIGLFFENQHEEAERYLQAAEASPSGTRYDEHFATVSLAEFQQRQGRLRQAAQAYREAAELMPDPIGLQAFPNGASYYFGLGNLLYERNELDGAEALLEQGREIVRAMRVAEAQAIALGYYALARLQQARGDSNAAHTILGELQDMARQRNFVPQVLAQAAAARAQLALMQSDLSAAVQWADTSGLGANDDLDYPRELEYLMLARVRIAQDRRDRADSVLPNILRLLDRLLAAAETGERIDSVIEICILRALAFQAQGTAAQALQCLEQALQLAEPESYVRVFIDEGAPLARLLGQALRAPHWGGAAPSSRSVRQYAEQLLKAAYAEGIERHSGAPASSTQYSVADSEPLTERELDVLRLLVAGYSNRAIARELVVAIGTVKRHVNNILGKLRVQSRLQAVARARELDLL